MTSDMTQGGTALGYTDASRAMVMDVAIPEFFQKELRVDPDKQG